MSNRNTHLKGGVIIGIICLLALKINGVTFDAGDALAGLLCSALGAVVPDLLEPATSAFHRHFFHSVLFLLTLLVIMHSVYTRILVLESADGQSCVLMFAVAGCISHLILDSLTTAGLPLID